MIIILIRQHIIIDIFDLKRTSKEF